MLIGSAIRDVVLIEALDLSIGPGLTALTGETGAGKSIILDALGLATGARGDAGLVRRGAEPGRGHRRLRACARRIPSGTILEDKGLDLRAATRIWSCAARSRPTAAAAPSSTTRPAGVGVLRELGEALLEVHGQHETVGLLDARTHRAAAGRLWRPAARSADVGGAWRRLARGRASGVEALRADVAALGRRGRGADAPPLRARPPGPPRRARRPELAEERAMLGAAEKALADIADARETFDGLGGKAGRRRSGPWSGRASGADRRRRGRRPRRQPAGRRRRGAWTAPWSRPSEAEAAIDAAAEAFDFEPDRLEKTEERLFDLRGLARKLNVTVDELAGAARCGSPSACAPWRPPTRRLKAAEAAARRGARAPTCVAAQTLSRRAPRRRRARWPPAVMAELAPAEAGEGPLPRRRRGPAGGARRAGRPRPRAPSRSPPTPARPSATWAPSPRAASWPASPWP